MPTALPRPPGIEKKRSVLSIVFNAALMVSALILTFIVLVQQQHYAMGKPGIFANAMTQVAQQSPPERAGRPPSN